MSQIFDTIYVMRVHFDHSEEEGPGIRTFWFRPERSLDYTAGQYTELLLPHTNQDSRGMKRWFTLSSSPGREFVSITTRQMSHGSTFKKALFELQPGAELSMTEPMGDFVLPLDPTIPLIFVAGGIGITPFHSMLSWLANHNDLRTIAFVYAVHNEGEIILQRAFEQANIHPTIIVSDPSDAWGGERGHLNAEMVLALAKPADNALIYMSGPEEMVEALKKDMLRCGVDQRQLITDLFLGYEGM
jgi:ferredoxin-NADP reductase